MASLSYAELWDMFIKGKRRGNWRWLNRKEKALYRAAYTRPSTRKSKDKVEMATMDIVNRILVEKLLGLIEMLKETKGMRIFSRGFKKAVALLQQGEESGVFYMGAFVTVLVERPGLYLLAGYGAVKRIGKECWSAKHLYYKKE